MSAEVVLSARIARHAYPAIGDVLRDVTLDLRRGEIVSIMGPSGAGKSTLLRCLAGIEQPSAGEVFLEGAPVLRPSRRIGLLFQQSTLFPWMTVLENALFGMEVADPALAREALSRVGLKGFEGSFPSQISGGMAQRVGLVRALAAKPRILLMDEPFAALDSETRELAHDVLLREISSGLSVIAVTHDVDEAVKLADRLVVLSNRPATVRQRYEIALQRPRSQNGIVSKDFYEVRNQVATSVRAAFRDFADEPPAAS